MAVKGQKLVGFFKVLGYRSWYPIVLLFCFFISTVATAQPSIIKTRKNPYKWMFGLSWNFINDNEEKIDNLGDVSRSWYGMYFPTRLSADRYLRRGWSWEVMAAYNQFKPKHIINESSGRAGTFLSTDFHMKFSPYKRINSKILEPYISAGLGVTYRSRFVKGAITPTANLAVGANLWLSEQFGIQLQAIGKLAISDKIYVTKNDYLQLNAGFVFRKGPSKKSNHFDRKRHNWTNKKHRYKSKKNY
jgi:hypothetical protein